MLNFSRSSSLSGIFFVLVGNPFQARTFAKGGSPRRARARQRVSLVDEKLAHLRRFEANGSPASLIGSDAAQTGQNGRRAGSDRRKRCIEATAQPAHFLCAICLRKTEAMLWFSQSPDRAAGLAWRLRAGREKDREMSALDGWRTTPEASGEGSRFFIFFGCNSLKSPYSANKTKQIQGFLLGFIWICLRGTRTLVESGRLAGQRRRAFRRVRQSGRRRRRTRVRRGGTETSRSRSGSRHRT